jgi:protein-S-isoprenylcysteine O-methyltransferase Ste14
VACALAFGVFLLLAPQTSTVSHEALVQGRMIRWQTTATRSLYQVDGPIVVVLALVPFALCGVALAGAAASSRGRRLPVVGGTVTLGCVLIVVGVLSLVLAGLLLALAGGCLLGAAGVLARRRSSETLATQTTPSAWGHGE